MKLVALALAGAAASLTFFVGGAAATNECRGLQVCVPVAGPWVVVPSTGTVPRAPVEYQLSCPKGYIVGGLDAELTDRSIDVTFAALLGSPVNPGISTSRAALFTAVAVGRPLAAASFRPHIGCLPGSGGGRRTPTIAQVVPPGHPSTRRVSNVTILPGTRRIAKTCAAGETLVGATNAVGFYTPTPPAASLVHSVRVAQTVRGGRVTVTVRSGAAVRPQRGIVQIDLVCAGGA